MDGNVENPVVRTLNQYKQNPLLFQIDNASCYRLFTNRCPHEIDSGTEGGRGTPDIYAP